MRKNTVVEFRKLAQEPDLLSTMLRDGAQRLVAQAVQAEFEEFLARFSGERLRRWNAGDGVMQAMGSQAMGSGLAFCPLPA